MKWVKYTCIVIKSKLTDNQVVNWCGSSYIVYGRVVKKIRADK